MKYEDRQIPKLLGVILIGLLFFATHTITPAQTTEQLAETALATTVYLEMMDSTGATLSIGSGFFVQYDLIATNYHVIEGAARGTAKIVGKYKKYTIQGVTATDKGNDLVLLKVAAYGIKPLPLGNSDQVKIGTQVYVAGNPKGLEGTFSNGIISSKRGGSANARLQMTAPISPGSSGGPVLNTRGEVIGVSFMTIEGGQNLNFAIPSNYLKTLLSLSKRVRPLSNISPTISAETYYFRGHTQFLLRNYHGAIAAYDAAISLNPDDAETYYWRGRAKGGLGQYFAAIADYDVAISLNPDDAETYHWRGRTKGGLGQYFAAISDFNIAIRLNPDDATVYYARGVTKAGLDQHFAAIADYDIAIRLNPDDATVYYWRGAAKAGLDQHFAAIADYDIAIRLNPDFAYAYVKRGAAKAGLDQHFAAIADYDIAIRLNPDDAWAYYARGVAKDGLDQHFAAIADYDIAIRLNPDDAWAYYARGVSKGLLNRPREAKQDLRTALRLAEKAGDTSLKSDIEEALRIPE